MSDVFEPELNQEDIVSQESMDASAVAEPVEDATPAKKGLVNSILSMGIFNAMLLLSLIFIVLATLNMLGVLRTYNEGFPFGGGGYPWSTTL